MGGNSPSKPQTNNRENKAQRLKQVGIFVPPTFAVNLDRDADTFWYESVARVEGRYTGKNGSDVSGAPWFSWVEQCRRDDASYRILNDYMQPGVWMQSVSENATVLASLRLANAKSIDGGDGTSDDTNAKSTDKRMLQGRILVGRSLQDDQTQFRLQGGTHDLPRLTCKSQKNDKWEIGGEVMPRGESVLTGKYVTFINPNSDVQLKLGARLPFPTKSSSLVPKLYCMATVGTGPNGWKLAGDATVQYNVAESQVEVHDTRLFGSVQLQDDTMYNNSPVQLSLELTPDTSAVALTQRFLFDRISLNVADDRAPKVRNTAGWTLRMERPLSAENNSSAMVTAGAVWQWNRALAIKGVVHDESVKLALIAKRWKHPRITCSVMGQYHWPSQTASWLGVGLELETGRLSTAGVYNDGRATGEEAPPTQVRLPQEA